MFELIILMALAVIAYVGIIDGQYVSDDIDGLLYYDGKPKEFSYGAIIKWITFKLFGRGTHGHHIFSILLHGANAVLLCLFLTPYTGREIAFAASALFAVHPVNAQSIAWVSGRGYPISLFAILLSYNLSQFISFSTNQITLVLLTIAYLLLYCLSVEALFATLMTFVVQIFLGNYYLAFLGILCTAGLSSGIIREVIGLRTKVFKEQNLGNSTYLKPQKLIVAFKTLGYYLYLCLWPKRMGLYHTYEYHYTDKTEKEDKMFWFGFFAAVVMAGLFWFGPVGVKLAVLWFIAYIFVFLNWITIHQFVSERYTYAALPGLCILLAYVLTPMPALLWLLVGLYLMRTWVHLPTFQDEVAFYQSNVWNFPESEVAFGNLGVTYMRNKLIGSAIEMWMIATKINPEYDVAWYNLASIHRQRGDLEKAREFLTRAVNSKMCHFKEPWTKELNEVIREQAYSAELTELQKKLEAIASNPETKSAADGLRKQMDEINRLHITAEENRKREVEVLRRDQSELKAVLIRTEEKLKKAENPVPVEQLIAARDKNMDLLRNEIARLYNANSASGIQKG